MNKEKSRAYINIIMAVIIWGTIGVFRRNIPMSSSALAWVRAVLGTVVLFLASVIFRSKEGDAKEKLSGKLLISLAVSGVLVGANWILLFESYRYTTVATATLCYYMEPTILILLSPVFFRERLGMRKILCALAALAGMAMISGIFDTANEGNSSLLGVGLGLGAAVLYALVVVINKKFPYQDAIKKTRIQLLSAAIVLGGYLVIIADNSFLDFSKSSIILTLIVGVVHTGIAYVLFYKSVEKLPATAVAIISYIDPVLALILSAIVLGERMTTLGIIGAFLIILAAVVSEMPIKREI